MSLAAFTAFDWLLLIILILSTLHALTRGIIKVLFSIGGLILGIIVASWNYLALAHRLTFIPSFAAAQIIAFILILVAVIVVCSILARVLRSAVSTIGLGFIDRLLGAAFGFLRGLLLGVVLMMALTAFFPAAPWLQRSALAPYFLSGAHALSFVIPRHFGEQIAHGATVLLQQSPELFKPHTLGQHP